MPELQSLSIKISGLHSEVCELWVWYGIPCVGTFLQWVP